MTAPQPATPGSDGEVCACRGINEVPGCTHGLPRPAAPSPVATTEPPTETVEEMAARTGWPVEFLNARVVFHPEPPAEAQQDDERCSCPDDWMSSEWDGPRTVRGDHHLSDCPLRVFPARPSADTETLRRAIAAAEQRGYERAQNECPPGGWESGL